MTRTELQAALDSVYPWIYNEKLYSCNAKIINGDLHNNPVTINGKRVKVLRSYSTNVAVYYNGVVYALARYSATTCQHIHKFAEYMGGGNWRNKCPAVWLYAQSKTPAAVARANAADDYASLLKAFD